MKKANIVFAAIFFAFSFFVFYSTAAYNAAGSSGDPGPAFWPRLLAILLVVLSILMVIEGFTSKKFKDEKSPLNIKTDGMKRVFITFAIFGCYAVLLRTCGYVISSLLFIPAIMRVLNEKSWIKCILTSVIITTAIYIVFKLILRVQLVEPMWV